VVERARDTRANRVFCDDFAPDKGPDSVSWLRCRRVFVACHPGTSPETPLRRTSTEDLQRQIDVLEKYVSHEFSGVFDQPDQLNATGRRPYLPNPPSSSSHALLGRVVEFVGRAEVGTSVADCRRVDR